MALVDSVDKIVGSYFKLVTASTFTYKGELYEPKPLRISPGIFRGYTCPEKCGGCCFRFSLDYLPSEDRPDDDRIKERKVAFDGRQVPIFSDLQDDHTSHFCNRLRLEDGRCGIHGKHPFTCDFELIRAITADNEFRPNWLTTRLYGRGWAFTRVDSEKGSLCEIIEVSDESIQDVYRKLTRLAEWAHHFGIATCLGPVLEWVRTGPHEEPLWVNTQFAKNKVGGLL